MTKNKQALTAQEIQSAKPKANKYELVDSATRAKGAGRLVVRVTPSGTKEFAYKYTFEGARRYISIGNFPATSLAVAREKIIPLTNQVKQGIDPKKALAKEKEQKAKAEKALLQSIAKRHRNTTDWSAKLQSMVKLQSTVKLQSNARHQTMH